MAVALMNDWKGVKMEDILVTIVKTGWIRTASARMASRIKQEGEARGMALSIVKSSGTFVVVPSKEGK